MAITNCSLLKEAQADHALKRKQYNHDVGNVNIVLAKEKSEREKIAQEIDKKKEDVEVEYWTRLDWLTENKATEVSMLAPHRVKPYHFKGMTQAQ